MREYLEIMLTLAGFGNLLCLLAGVQVPYVLRWGEELKRLQPFNRKIFLNYYFYVGGMILLWSVLSLFLQVEILEGGVLAAVIVAVMLVFWLTRILVDIFYFSSSDWPEGRYFLIGRVLLSGVFFYLTITYASVLIFILF